MNRKKIAIIAGALLLLLAIVGFTVRNSRRSTVEVQTGRVQRQDLVSIVSASGEIKPLTYVNVGANAYGKIVKLYVHEGEHVKRGQVLAQLENVQSAAEVAAMQAALQAVRNDAVAAEAGYRTARADLDRATAEAQRLRFDYDRAEGLYKEALISKAEYDMRKAAFEAADAVLAQTRSRINQTQAQLEASQGRVRQAEATLRRASDVLEKTTYIAPYDGVVTNLPVREGENVVMGIQNSPGSTLMTIADLSVITAEVKVDETDIVNVKVGQPAEVSIDAIPRKTFKGRVTEIGNNAIVRSTGVATSQSLSSSQEAKDFKVVVTLEDPPENLRPGLSATAKITSARREQALAIPIQALTVRQKSDLEAKSETGSVQAASPPKGKDEEIQGVFVVRGRKAEFIPVDTGITGTTEIEVLEGLKEGDEIVTGSYKALRSLKNGASVKVNNTRIKKDEES